MRENGAHRWPAPGCPRLSEAWALRSDVPSHASTKEIRNPRELPLSWHRAPAPAAGQAISRSATLAAARPLCGLLSIWSARDGLGGFRCPGRRRYGWGPSGRVQEVGRHIRLPGSPCVGERARCKRGSAKARRREQQDIPQPCRYPRTNAQASPAQAPSSFASQHTPAIPSSSAWPRHLSSHTWSPGGQPACPPPRPPQERLPYAAPSSEQHGGPGVQLVVVDLHRRGPRRDGDAVPQGFGSKTGFASAYFCRKIPGGSPGVRLRNRGTPMPSFTLCRGKPLALRPGRPSRSNGSGVIQRLGARKLGACWSPKRERAVLAGED